MVITKNVRQALRRFGWVGAVVLLWSCSSDLPDAPESPAVSSDEVIVTFSAGSSVGRTRAAFSDGTPLKLFVYQRAGSVADFSVAPYKTVTGETSGTAANGLSSVLLTGGDMSVTDDGSMVLTVRSNKTYDFVVVVSGASGAALTDIGTLSAGVISGFGHGMDILASKQQGVYANYGSNINVVFNGSGTDGSGNLPHLGSSVCVQGKVTQPMFNFLMLSANSFTYGVSGIDFNQCLPRSGNLLFAGNPISLNVLSGGYNTSYSARLPVSGSTEVTVTDVSQTVSSADGYLLPCPLRDASLAYNTMNLDFHLRVNGADALFEARGVRVPAFKAGYRYTFIVELDYDPIAADGIVNLCLSIAPWSSLSWQSGMGKDDDTEDMLIIALGSWSSVTWRSAMGGDDTGSKVITSIAGWRSATWASIMGEQ